MKFLSPIVIGGLPLPGSAAPPEALELELDPPADEDDEDEDEDEELPQAANAAIVKTTPAPDNTRFNIVAPLLLAIVGLYLLTISGCPGPQ
ncbi:MAG: hypothetical protein WCB67_10235 [Solirubrobacteraceae bacterium]